MDWSHIEMSWDFFKTRVREKWGKLSEDDLETIAGHRGRLEDKIHERYGFAIEHVRKKVADWSRWQSFWKSPQRTPLIRR